MELILRDQRVVVDEAHKAFWEVFRAGKWEEATLDTFDRHLDPSTVFVDIGAWIGPTTLYAAARAKRVIAIEADPVAAGLLRKNVALNPLLAERIEIIERAISSERGTLRMGSKGSKGDSMSSVFLVEKKIVGRSKPSPLLRSAGNSVRTSRSFSKWILRGQNIMYCLRSRHYSNAGT